MQSETKATGSVENVVGCCPLDCPDTCSWVVTVKDGVPTALMGNREHPYTRGALCVKVSKYHEYLSHPDRITTPLIRTGRKGAGEFREASWEECFELIANRFQRDIDAHGPESIWPHISTGSFGYIHGIFGAGYRLFNYLGASRNAVTNCSVSGEMASAYTLGEGSGLEPMMVQHANLIILWGTNTISTNQHLRHFLTLARKQNGAKIICIDPVRSKTAEFADEHIPILPGTDGALAFGLMSALLEENLIDEEFLSEHSLGWEDLRPRVESVSLIDASCITGIDEERIRNLAREMAEAKPCAIRMMQGMQRHAGGGMAVRSVMALSTLLGDWKYPGGGAAYDVGAHFQANYDKLWAEDLRPDPKARTIPVTRTGEALLELNDPPVQSLFLGFANPLISAPNSAKVRQGLLREDLFTVCADHFMTETAKHADVFLPGTMQMEHNDLFASWGHLYISWNAKAVDAPGECKPMSEMFRGIAKAMNLNEPRLLESDDDLARAALDSDHPHMQGITLEALKEKGFIRQNIPEDTAVSKIGFNTPSGKIELFSQSMADDGLDPVPRFTLAKEAADQRSKYPYALVSPGSHYFLNSVFGNFGPNVGRQGEQTVFIHPGDAEQKQIANDDLVDVFNDRGSYCARAVVTDAVLQGVLMSFKGHWVDASGKVSNVNATVDERDSDIGQGAVFNDNKVDVRLHTGA